MSGRQNRWLKNLMSAKPLEQSSLSKVAPFIIFICALLVVDIAWSLYVEKTLTRQEHLEKEIEDLRIEYTHKDLELTGFNQRTLIEKMLQEQNSTLHEPVEPAELIKKGR
jgi:Tfp pilus assembly protein PilO